MLVKVINLGIYVIVSPVNQHSIVFSHIALFVTQFSIQTTLNRNGSFFHVADQIFLNNLNNFSLLPVLVNVRTVKPSMSHPIGFPRLSQKEHVTVVIYLMVCISIVQRIVGEQKHVPFPF